MIRELSRLYTPTAIREKINWNHFEYLLVTQTNIELPIINNNIYSERDEYSKRLKALDTFTSNQIDHIVKTLPTFYPRHHHQQQQFQPFPSINSCNNCNNSPPISLAAKLRSDINISLNRHYSTYVSPSKIPSTLSSSSAITLAAMGNIKNIISTPESTAKTINKTTTITAQYDNNNENEKEVSMLVEEKMNNKFIIPTYEEDEDEESVVMVVEEEEEDGYDAEKELLIDTLINARFTTIASDELKKLKDILRNSNNNAEEVVKDHFNTEMTQYKMSCLRPRTWLNDEVGVSRLELTDMTF